MRPCPRAPKGLGAMDALCTAMVPRIALCPICAADMGAAATSRGGRGSRPSQFSEKLTHLLVHLSNVWHPAPVDVSDESDLGGSRAVTAPNARCAPAAARLSAS